MSEPLTVLIICKNEAQHIHACIESARSVADEILLADSGSTDNTLEIARQLGGVHIIQREFVDYGSFRNWAVPQATSPWVLILDADERLTPSLSSEILKILYDPPDGIDGYWIRARFYFLGHEIRHGGWGTHRNLRLFRRELGRYGPQRVHESPNIARRRTRKLRRPLVHFSISSYDDYFRKYVTYTRLGASDMWEAGERTGRWKLSVRPFLRFAWLYFVRLGFLDGLAGLQICMLQAFFVSFVKQARLWEKEQLVSQLSSLSEQVADTNTRHAETPVLESSFASGQEHVKECQPV